MRVFKLGVLIGWILLLSGCIPSLHGIVTDQDRVTNDRILGTWKMGDGGLATIQRPKNEDPQPSDEDEVEIWTIERVANITYSTNENNTFHQSTIIGGAQATVPTDATILSREEEPYYFLTETSIEKGDTLTNQIIVQLTNIGSSTFIDFKPFEGAEKLEKFSLFYPNVIPAHTFGGIEIENGQLTIKPFDSEFIEELIRTKRIRLKHEVLAGGDIVLTASTEDLRTFIGKYAEDERLYESSWNFQSLIQ